MKQKNVVSSLDFLKKETPQYKGDFRFQISDFKALI
jgi:hypothetical protein